MPCGISALLLGCFGLYSIDPFGIAPPPDGGYPGSRGGLGLLLCSHLTRGTFNAVITATVILSAAAFGNGRPDYPALRNLRPSKVTVALPLW